MKVKRVAVGEYATNCYIIISADEKSVMLIDPSFDIPRIEHFVGDKRVTDIVLTHAHIDHIYEAPVLREKYGAKVYIGKHDAPLLENRTLYAPQNCMAYCENRKYPVDVLLEDGDEVNFSDYKFRVLELPGHTPGGIALYGEDALFCGDVLFYRSCGRTDFELGNADDMEKSLQRLAALNPDTRVYPGHGFTTTIGSEIENNPFMKQRGIEK